MAEKLDALIPQVRRAIDGPAATGADSPATTLTDTQLKGLIADAVAEVIFYTGGLFGHELVVTERDATYGAPTDWEVDPELTDAEATVIVVTAALNHFFHIIRDLKVAETIRDEGAEWTYQLSAQLLTEQVRYLQNAREQALTQVEAAQPVGVAFVDLVHGRDRAIVHAIESLHGEWHMGLLP